MNYLDYWIKQFPTFISKTNEWEKRLLANQDPSKLAVYTEQDLVYLLELLKDFEVRRKEGKLSESIIYKKSVKDLQDVWEKNLAWNGLAQVVSIALLTAGISMLATPDYMLPGALHAIPGAMLSLVAIAKLGIRNTLQRNAKKLSSRFGVSISPEDLKKECRLERKALMVLVYIPILSSVCMASGMLASDLLHNRVGLIVGGIGGLALIADMVYWWRLTKKAK